MTMSQIPSYFRIGGNNCMLVIHMVMGKVTLTNLLSYYESVKKWITIIIC
jgi:hypothetical protein